MPLTDTYIRSLKAADKEQKHFDGGGLYLSIPKTGRKLWRMAYRFDQKTKLLSFGEYPTITLKDARSAGMKQKSCWRTALTPERRRKPPRKNSFPRSKIPF